jgi:hypothetical protein
MDPLTPRECQVAMLVTRGLSNKEVARQLGVSDGTLKLHAHTTSCRSLVVEYDLGDSTSHRTGRQLDVMTFVGRSVPRLENDALLTGNGCFAADVTFARCQPDNRGDR